MDLFHYANFVPFMTQCKRTFTEEPKWKIFALKIENASNKHLAMKKSSHKLL
uniref:Uncharacterized protein n=1 Tax=Arundo donax TaxID=35708 RepID=A0A0A9CD43_ARUDO